MAASVKRSSLSSVFARAGFINEKRCPPFFDYFYSFSSSMAYDSMDDEGTIKMVQLGAHRPKNVLILMSDTGGGHRASAEAIGDAFKLEFGDEYDRPVIASVGVSIQTTTNLLLRDRTTDYMKKMKESWRGDVERMRNDRLPSHSK